MIQYFKIISHHTTEVTKPDPGTWVNVLPPLRQEEFSELSNALSIPLDFLKDSLDNSENSSWRSGGSTFTHVPGSGLVTSVV